MTAKRVVGTFFCPKEKTFGMLLQDDKIDGSFLTIYNISGRKCKINVQQALQIIGHKTFTEMSGPLITQEVYDSILDIHENNPKLAKKLPFEIKITEE